MSRDSHAPARTTSRPCPRLAAVACLTLGLTLLAAGAGAQTPEADVFVARAVLAYEDKRYAEALADLQEALRLAPDHVDALYIGLSVPLPHQLTLVTEVQITRARSNLDVFAFDRHAASLSLVWSY